ncbi:MAG: anaerobic ribonucleoside-triphosphate reductase activating protein [Oscillospiraceae bacterium]|nr:anaerobic ribonucleoside-triphosphate reductase activating protein [Oscillospiraceae bacterium]
MNISGFQKMTLLDFPGVVACTLFTSGCNFRCPFCHNASLVTHIDNSIRYSEEEVLEYLEKRKGVLDGVCITGGEPLLQGDIAEFLGKIKEMGYLIKLDTNGSFPEKLASLVEMGLLDYVAMDIKNSKEKYAETTGKADLDISAIEKSVSFLMSGKVDYEFRTTVVKELHSEEDIENIALWLKGAKKYFLQNFVDSGDLISENLSAVDSTVLCKMQQIARQFIVNTEIRGV